MNLAPFSQAEPAVQVHVAFALVAAVTGVAVFAMRKGTQTHRVVGRLWLGSMVLVALSSFFIHQLRIWGPLSPLHLLSVFTLASVVYAVLMVRRGNIIAHAMALTGLFLGGIVGAGVLAMGRGLLMSRILFDGKGWVPAPQNWPGGPVVAGFGVALFVTIGVVMSRLFVAKPRRRGHRQQVA